MSTPAQNFPPFVTGDEQYGITNMSLLSDTGFEEYQSKDNKFNKRKTYALRIGYFGGKYKGYQMQSKELSNNSILTVESDLKAILRLTTVAAGRTDKEVSAVSQIVCLQTFNSAINEEYILGKFCGSEPVMKGRLAIYSCVRVPRTFHSMFSATWRRYLYLFPLNIVDYNRDMSPVFDVDIKFVDQLLGQLEGKMLPFNTYAYREERNTGQGKSDICTLDRSRAYYVDLFDFNSPAPDPRVNGGHDPFPSTPTPQVVTPAGLAMITYPAVCIEFVGDRFLRRMVRILVVRKNYNFLNYDAFNQPFSFLRQPLFENQLNHHVREMFSSW